MIMWGYGDMIKWLGFYLLDKSNLAMMPKGKTVKRQN